MKEGGEGGKEGREGERKKISAPVPFLKSLKDQEPQSNIFPLYLSQDKATYSSMIKSCYIWNLTSLNKKESSKLQIILAQLTD